MGLSGGSGAQMETVVRMSIDRGSVDACVCKRRGSCRLGLVDLKGEMVEDQMSIWAWAFGQSRKRKCSGA